MSKVVPIEEIEDVVVQETPEQILAAQQDGFTEAVSSTHVKSATEIAEQAKTDEEAVAKAEAEKVAAEAAEATAKAKAEEAVKAAAPGLSSEQVAEIVNKQLSSVYG